MTIFARSLIVIVLSAASLFVAPANASTIERQREIFKSVIEDVERGDWSAVERLDLAERELLQQYVLWPDLRATYLRATISKSPDVEVQSFLEQYGTLRSARELRYRYAVHLAKNGDLQAFQRI